MATFRTVLIFRANGVRFSEAYALDGIDNLANARLQALPMIKQRLKLCGLGTELLGVRISPIPATRQIELILPNENEWQNPAKPSASTNGAEVERPTSVVLVDLFAADGRRAKHYMGGMPDHIHSETAADGLRLDRGGDWKNQFDIWAAMVTQQPGQAGGANWGFMGETPPNAQNSRAIVGGSIDPATGELRVHVAGNQEALFPRGVKVMVVGNRREVAAFKGPNGKHVVKASSYLEEEDVTQITLQGLRDVDPARWLVGSYGILKLRGQQFFKIAKVKINRAGRRDRKEEGFSSVRGRGPTRKVVV
ncbi:MAG TPA: hypothetical protein VNO52_13110 [Methylomirabilota bacterium]|nr:hypothetical protein [Methylomirabilota bacterium]